jgi:hypothetical protein|eukprot:COSAG06_NODE_3277_length_5568_cov_58.371000_4_plen_147_part_00
MRFLQVGKRLLLSGPVADPRLPAFRARVNLTVWVSNPDDGASWDKTRKVQVTDGPGGYSCLALLPAGGRSAFQPQRQQEQQQEEELGGGGGGGGADVGLLFEQSDHRLCEAVLPSWVHAPDGTARGLGAESCKISYQRLPGLVGDV